MDDLDKFEMSIEDQRATSGGASTSGHSFDPDGCTAVWRDDGGSTTAHMEDHVVVDSIN